MVTPTHHRVGVVIVATTVGTARKGGREGGRKGGREEGREGWRDNNYLCVSKGEVAYCMPGAL